MINHRFTAPQLSTVLAVLSCFVFEGSANASPHPVIQSPEQPPLISSGESAGNCQWPTAVLLYADGALCTGTLVHPQIVTTAAHCPHPTKILFGEDGQPQREAAVDHCKRNPDYSPDDNNGVNGDDFAYCKLKQPIYDIPFTPPVYGCELEILTPGRPAVIAGFGNYEGETGAGTKRWAETQIQTLVGEFSTTVSVGSTGTAACSGDSGGPAYVQYPDGSWHVFGTTSGGPPCGSGADIYSLIHRAVPWIEKNSGIDITPCHDVDGNWNPTPECQGFALDTLDSSADWSNWCAAPRLGPAATCGEAFNHKPDHIAPIVDIAAPFDGESFQGPQATFDILVDAKDQGHGVKTVMLEINGKVISTDKHAPWKFAHAQFPEGGWILVALAEDWNGNVARSEPIALGVGEDPPELPDEDDENDDDGPTSATSVFDEPRIYDDGVQGCVVAPANDRTALLATVLGLLGLVSVRRRRHSPR